MNASLRFLADENFDGDILNGLRRQRPDLEIIRVQDVGLMETDDEIILEWAAQRSYILLTQDYRTMIAFAYERVRAGLALPGVVEVSRDISIGRAIEDLLLMIECSIEGDWENRVRYVPL